MLALTEQHFVLVTETEGGWLAGSGRYKRKEHDIRLEAMRWFEVRDGKADYAADETFEATFDGKMFKAGRRPQLPGIQIKTCDISSGTVEKYGQGRNSTYFIIC